MDVSEVMTCKVLTCHIGDSLNLAAQIMWDNKCGCVVVVAGLGKPVGVITDRDICMAAYTRGKPLGELRVSRAASHHLITARPTDSVESALACMQHHNIRRLPITDENGRLMGIVSMFDLPRPMEQQSVCSAAAVLLAP